MENVANLRDRIEQLDKKNQVEVFRIFNKHGCSFTENKNGVFMNLSVVASEVINEIQEYLKYVEKQENQLEELESEKMQMKETFFKDNKEEVEVSY